MPDPRTAVLPAYVTKKFGDPWYPIELQQAISVCGKSSQKQPNIGSHTDNIAFHRTFVVPGGLALWRAFCQWKNVHQLSTDFSFSFFFCNRFHTDGLHYSHAQMHSIVVLIPCWQESRLDIYISARFQGNCMWSYASARFRKFLVNIKSS